MWNFIANQCEFTCEKACEMQVKMCVKGLTYFTPFSHMFHYVIFHTRVKYECEIHVKSSEKHVKQM